MITGPKGDVMAAAATDWIDLADRAGDGLVVTLLWSRATGSVRVIVADHRQGGRLAVDVTSDHALDAFYHPFAYAS